MAACRFTKAPLRYSADMIRACTFLVALLSMLLPAAAPGAASPEDWQRVLDLRSGLIAGATFATDDVAWAAGVSGLFGSEDGGRTWHVAYESSGLLADVDAAPDGIHGWAVGVRGEALYTADGGQTWNVRDVGSALNLNLVEVIDADTTIIAGEGEEGLIEDEYGEIIEPQPQTIRRTDDGGNTWIELEIDGFTAIAISFIDSRLGWISGRRCEPRADGRRGCASRSAALFRTQDGGATWTRVGREGLYRTLVFTSKEDGWATRASCTNPRDDDCSWRVAATHDGGDSWTDLRIGYDDFPLQLSAFADNAALVYEYANLLERSGRTHEAEKALRDLLSRDPIDAGALNSLGYMLAERGGSLIEAVNLVQRALKIDPANPSFLDSLGWAFFKQGRIDLADAPLSQAAAKLPTSAAVQDHLGDLRCAQQRWADAAAAFERALAGDVEAADRPKIELKLSVARDHLRK